MSYDSSSLLRSTSAILIIQPNKFNLNRPEPRAKIWLSLLNSTASMLYRLILLYCSFSSICSSCSYCFSTLSSCSSSFCSSYCFYPSPSVHLPIFNHPAPLLFLILLLLALLVILLLYLLLSSHSAT